MKKLLLISCLSISLTAGNTPSTLTVTASSSGSTSSTATTSTSSSQTSSCVSTANNNRAVIAPTDLLELIKHFNLFLPDIAFKTVIQKNGGEEIDPIVDPCNPKPNEAFFLEKSSSATNSEGQQIAQLTYDVSNVRQRTITSLTIDALSETHTSTPLAINTLLCMALRDCVASVGSNKETPPAIVIDILPQLKAAAPASPAYLLYNSCRCQPDFSGTFDGWIDFTSTPEVVEQYPLYATYIEQHPNALNQKKE